MSKFQYIAFYKPYGVLCQFTGEKEDRTLAEFNIPKDVYAAGRLDKDSEGLLILTNDGVFNQKVTSPRSNKEKTYWVQVERIPTPESLEELACGVVIKGGYKTLACTVEQIEPPDVPARFPPIRQRKSVPDCWLEIKVVEGKNRQVRSMTAKIGHPTLRLIRVSVGKKNIDNLVPGEWVKIKPNEVI
jgi:23S rRNA pseudouridine2457 synthase